MLKWFKFNAYDILNVIFTIFMYTKLYKTCVDSSYFVKNRIVLW